MVRQALKKSIHGVESVASERSGDLPHVMWFVKILYMNEENMIITYIKDISSVRGINESLHRMVINMAKCVIWSTLVLAAESAFKIRNNMHYALLTM